MRKQRTRGGTAFLTPSVRRDRGRFYLLREHKGTLFVLMSAVLYSIGGLCIKVIPWNGMAINGGRTAIALVVIGIYLYVTKHPLKFNRWVLLGAVAVFSTNALYTIANKLTTAANTIVLQFTAPIFVLLFSAILAKQKPQKLDVAACAVVFGGILFFFLDSLEMGGGLGNILALISGLTYAGVFMMNDMPDSDAISSVFFGDIISSVTGLPFFLQETQFPPEALVSLLVLGVFQVALAYIFLCIGLKTTPSITASLVSGVEPILNPVLVAIFYGETVGVYALIGGMIVIAGVVGYNILKIKQDKVEGEDIHDLL